MSYSQLFEDSERPGYQIMVLARPFLQQTRSDLVFLEHVDDGLCKVVLCCKRVVVVSYLFVSLSMMRLHMIHARYIATSSCKRGGNYKK